MHVRYMARAVSAETWCLCCRCLPMPLLVPLSAQQVGGAGNMLGDLLAVCLRTTPTATAISAARNRDVPLPAPLPLVVRTLLLLRNLALAPSTGQVNFHPSELKWLLVALGVFPLFLCWRVFSLLVGSLHLRFCGWWHSRALMSRILERAAIHAFGDSVFWRIAEGRWVFQRLSRQHDHPTALIMKPLFPPPIP